MKVNLTNIPGLSRKTGGAIQNAPGAVANSFRYLGGWFKSSGSVAGGITTFGTWVAGAPLRIFNALANNRVTGPLVAFGIIAGVVVAAKKMLFDKKGKSAEDQAIAQEAALTEAYNKGYGATPQLMNTMGSPDIQYRQNWAQSVAAGRNGINPSRQV